MGRPAKSVEEITLAGNSRKLSPQQLAARREAENTPLPLEQREELRKLDSLVAAALEKCARGQTVRGKRNPAFVNLSLLLKCRKLILSERRDAKQQGTAMLAELDKLLERTN
jgi:hypothetical protein